MKDIFSTIARVAIVGIVCYTVLTVVFLTTATVQFVGALRPAHAIE